ncbi:DMT family transporter [Virgibacillus sp. W0430]|uniref:DMT family transporter n=1 Tax=Virgibacillus sp. W0430 TaxID=3391580 RepID=UPI003F452C9C
MRPILIGTLGALFFSAAFIFNRSMELEGGSWAWSASLRFFFMLPMLLLIVGYKKNVKPVLYHLKSNPLQWILWSTIGFGLFYAPIAFGTVYAPGWLVAATFQLNIIAGSLLVPFINKEDNRHIPLSSVIISIIIIVGVFTMQIEQASKVALSAVFLSVIPLLVSSVSYPLGNRKMMQLVNQDLNTFQRILGMTIASMPFWIILSIYALITHGLPSSSQVTQTFIVAVSSGIIGTVLFFYATELVRNDNHKLAGVEATSSGEVVFALIGEMILLGAVLPGWTSILGMALVIIGIILHSMVSVLLERKRTIFLKRAVK